MTEHDLQNFIKLELSKIGFCVFRGNVGKGKTFDGRFFNTGLPKGFPDLFAVKDGKIIFIEVKSKNGKLKEEQKKFIKTMNDFYNTNVTVCYCIEDVLNLIKELKK